MERLIPGAIIIVPIDPTIIIQHHLSTGIYATQCHRSQVTITVASGQGKRIEERAAIDFTLTIRIVLNLSALLTGLSCGSILLIRAGEF
jgi:hypothetical protein